MVEYEITLDKKAYREMIYSLPNPMGFFSDLSKVEKALLGVLAILLSVGVPCSLGFLSWAIMMRLLHG